VIEDSAIGVRRTGSTGCVIFVIGKPPSVDACWGGPAYPALKFTLRRERDRRRAAGQRSAILRRHGRPADALEIASGIAMRDMTMPAYQKRRDRVWLRQAKALERSLRKKV